MKRLPTDSLPRFASLRLPVFALLALWLAASPARAWWDDAWTARKLITVDPTARGAAISEPIGPVTVLLRLHDGNFPFSAAKQDGSDLRLIAADDKTPLPFHIERFDPILNEAFVWVRLPDLPPSVPTNFWLYYANAGEHLDGGADSKASYDPDTVLVYHFDERSGAPRDSTAAANHALNAGAPVQGSLIGGGLRIDGHNPVTIPGSASLAWAEGAAMTWSAWVKFAPQAEAVIFRRGDDSQGFSLGLDRGVPFVEVRGPFGVQRTPAGPAIPANAWRHIAVVASGAKIVLYVNGEAYTTLTSALPALKGPSVLGYEGVTGGSGYSGEIDELEISKAVRTPGFVKFLALNQGGDASTKLLNFGDEEQATNWLSWLSNGYVGIILKSLTIDGWVVIGILLVMAAISWAVMVAKALYLNAVAAGNASFIREWRHLAADLTTLDGDDAEKIRSLGGRVDPAAQRSLRNSPIYRIYHIGAEEIRHRVSARNGGSKALSARSIQAIRASLDGGVVRETQKLNSLLVLLTIAISGGPFLGLLGTVVGVMITFASIAAAGDVNVNAIAPGIAAALAATVAGLIVAIPSLFGYNYLLSRVKDATNEMHIFVDEFVTKMAEYYSEP